MAAAASPSPLPPVVVSSDVEAVEEEEAVGEECTCAAVDIVLWLGRTSSG